METRSTSAGEEALDVYGRQNREINFVILDMIMPGMGGGDVFDRLKNIDEDVKVLLSSGTAERAGKGNHGSRLQGVSPEAFIDF